MNNPPAPRTISRPWRPILTASKVFTIYCPESHILSVLISGSHAHFGHWGGSFGVIFQVDCSIFSLRLDLRWICWLGDLVDLSHIIVSFHYLYLLAWSWRSMLRWVTEPLSTLVAIHDIESLISVLWCYSCLRMCLIYKLFPRRWLGLNFVLSSLTSALVQTTTRGVLCFLKRLSWCLLLRFAAVLQLISNRCIKLFGVCHISTVWIVVCRQLFYRWIIRLDNIRARPACESFSNGSFLDNAISNDKIFGWVDTLIAFTFIVSTEIDVTSLTICISFRTLFLKILLLILLILFNLKPFKTRLTRSWFFLTLNFNWLLLVVIKLCAFIWSSFTRIGGLVRYYWHGWAVLAICILQRDRVGAMWSTQNSFYSTNYDRILVS